MNLFSRNNKWMTQGPALLLALGLLLSLAGCGDSGGGKTLRADLSGRMTSLDPQYADSTLEDCILKNCMEGLLRRLPDGTLTEGCAESYTVSADSLTYTFTLREGLKWSDGEPLTAADFAFAFARLRDGKADANAIADFAAVKGMDGSGILGAAAPNERTFRLTLASPDPLILEKLTAPAAFPCRKEYYQNTHARYGNSLEYMIYNGPFTVSQWESGQIRLLANKNYVGLTPAASPAVLCTLNREDTVARFLAGETDCCRVDNSTLRRLEGETSSLLTFRNGTVSLLLNPQKGATASSPLRHALCYSVPLPEYVESGRLPEAYEYAPSVVPEAARLFDQSYGDLTKKGFALGTVTFADGETQADLRRANQLTVSYNKTFAQNELESMGKDESAEGLTLLLPQGSPLEDFAGWLQKEWLENLGLVVNLAIVEDATYRSRLASGDFTLALYSYTASDEVSSVFLHYGKNGSAPVRCSHDRYEELLMMGAAARDVSEAVRLFANAEAHLMDEMILMPLFYTESYFAMGRGVSGIQASADGAELFFAGGVREK